MGSGRSKRLLRAFAPEIKTCDYIFAGFLLVRIYDLETGVSKPEDDHESIFGLTSRVEECSIRMFLAVKICTQALVSTCLISMKLGSKASM